MKVRDDARFVGSIRELCLCARFSAGFASVNARARERECLRYGSISGWMRAYVCADVCG